MKREYKYQTIEKYVEHKKQARNSWAVLVLAFNAFLVSVIHLAMYHKGAAPPSATTVVTVDGRTISLSDNSVPLYPKTRSGYSLDQAKVAVKEAVRLWSIALGTRVEMPQVKLGGCEPVSYACADKAEYTIDVTDLTTTAGLSGEEPDAVTIMLHEVAHLLGVPHIEGDKLMNAVYLGKLAEPTRDAVAIARAHRKD